MVDMGNFSSNQDDLVNIEVDYITPIMLSSDGNPPINCFDSIEVLLDYVPQQYSYDNVTQTNTYSLAFMEKEFGQVQTKTYGGATLGGLDLNTDPEEILQVWKFTQKPAKIVVRPEVLQKKIWNIRLKFVYQDEPSTVVRNFSNGAYGTFFEQVGEYKIVLSCTH